ncbi:MAG: protein-export chaperone SecB [Alphaproteobacteria bacterium]|nr:MAG: protein-export chaperone SecB [Alphaproteobacteria bacterium]
MKISEITLIGQYIKDLSFENPMSPNVPPKNENPSVNLDINTTYLDLKNNNHEVNLKIKSTASIDKNVIFVIELQYAGLIKTIVKNEKDKKKLIISGSYLLFPYARSIISNITMEGGFKPLVIQPIDFENMFKK